MSLEQKFPGKRAFITGAASGLGLAMAECLARKGWKLLLGDIHETRLAEAEAKLRDMGADTATVVLDVTHPDAIQQAADRLQESWGGVDLVFNNAGIALAGTIEELSLEEWERVINVDLWSVINGCRIFAPILKRQGSGHIINTASSAGTLAGPEMAAYNVAKAGVVSLSETLKAELSRNNIGVTVICPTVFVTSLGDGLSNERKMEANLAKQLQESSVSASDIAEHVLWSVERERLYVMTQADARWGWRMKRLFPETFSRMIAYLYRNRKWIYAE